MRPTSAMALVVALLVALPGMVVACSGGRPSSGDHARRRRTRMAVPGRVAPNPARPAHRARPSLLDGPGVTFFVAADTHFGYPDLEPWNRRQVRAMNRLPGTAFPAALGGRVRRPLGVLVAGDLTNDGKRSQWKQFVRLFGLKGGDGLLKYPVFEGTGNHDYYGKRRYVANAVRRRHGSLSYVWTWHGVHFVCLDTHPRFAQRRWLRRQLRRMGRRVPVVIYFHYSIVGPFSNFWADMAKRTFRRSLDGYNVIAIFHGHYHHSEHYRWEGLDVYNVGSPLYDSPSFAVATVTAGHLTVAEWNWQLEQWDWHHQKRIQPGPDPKLLPPRKAKR